MDHVFHAQVGNSERHRPRYPKIVCGFYRARGQCSRGAKCSFVHEKPENIHRKEDFDNPLDDPFLVEFFAKMRDCPVEPPKDGRIKTLYVRRLNSTGILEQDIGDVFSAYGEIEAIKMVAERQGCAYVTFTTRQASEKAMEELKTWVDIKGHRLKVLWAHKYKPSADQKQRIGVVTSALEVGGPENHGASSSSACEMPPCKRKKIEPLPIN